MVQLYPLQALTVLSFTSSATAHMLLAKPVPYSADKGMQDNGPLDQSGSNYPCKTNLGFEISDFNVIPVGQEQQLAFSGTAVHGGGSCQLSVTTDVPPTKNSKFKVIKSIEGGCPGVNGPNTYTYTLPDSIPEGNATFAWTWFARLSGRREMYMNCAPISVTGGASDTSRFDQLPDMFIADIGTGCSTVDSADVKFPNPGQDVRTDGETVAPKGNCGSSSVGDAPPPDSDSETVAPSPSPSATSILASSSAPASVSVAPAPTNTGGILAPGASSAVPSSEGASTSIETTLITVTAVPTSAAPIGTGTAPGSSIVLAPSATTPSTSGGTTCSEDGALMCNGTSQFGLCNHGRVIWQAVAEGTQCSNGQIVKRFAHRALHLKRRGWLLRPHTH
ncbi:lytic polysaccharide monooxygenase [Patellaria atrata CBS 101060]|uniref:Lytic polysaccharide monooxygenase n=1 Tax=Patellaria atrata CBS 101060 TaxID=1346257 RepID=A0A9P4SEF7_9PEZI|nr:lytic polysaccharide monooxygenase [Patellaria atrata CBS 101060]